MTETLDVLNGLKAIIQRKFPKYTVEVDYPDLDRQKTNTTIFIQPDNGELENLTMASDECTMNITIYIVTKSDKSDVLRDRVWGCFENTYRELRSNPTLDGLVADSMVTDFDYFPAVMDNVSSQAITITLAIRFEKDFV